MEIEFKKVGVERLPEIVEANRDIFGDIKDWHPLTLTDYTEMIGTEKPTIFIAESEGQILGDLVAIPKGQELFCAVLGVLQDYRGQKIAIELMDLAEEFARQEGYEKMTAKVHNFSTRMLRFKLRRGYLIIDIEKHKDTERNAIFFELKL